MKKIKVLLIVATFCTLPTLQADPIITFFFKTYPHLSEQKLKKPGKIARYTLEGLAAHDIVNGVFSTYAGFFDVSSVNGQTLFPRKHTKPFLYIIVTNKMTPIPMMNNVIHHWELDPNTPASLFTVERKQDPQTELFFWDVRKTERPEDNNIPLESLIIIAKPHNIYVPTGITITNDSPNLLLPDIYVKKGINIVNNALYILTISHLFSPTHQLYKKEANRYSSHVEP